MKSTDEESHSRKTSLQAIPVLKFTYQCTIDCGLQKDVQLQTLGWNCKWCMSWLLPPAISDIYFAENISIKQPRIANWKYFKLQNMLSNQTFITEAVKETATYKKNWTVNWMNDF